MLTEIAIALRRLLREETASPPSSRLRRLLHEESVSPPLTGVPRSLRYGLPPEASKQKNESRGAWATIGTRDVVL